MFGAKEPLGWSAKAHQCRTNWNLRACECFEVPLVVSAMVVEENALASFNELGIR